MPRTFILQNFGLLILFLFALTNCGPVSDKKPLEEVDLAIENAQIITMDAEWSSWQTGTLLVRGGEIIALGPDSLLKGTYEAKKVIDGRDKILLPGLVNAHTHLPMTLLRGYADDLSLESWLQDHIWPAEAAIMDAEAVYAGSLLGMAELIRGGTTCFNDMYFFADEIAKAAIEAGLRGRVGEGLLDFPTPNAQDTAESLAYTRKLLQKYQDHPLVGVSISPHSPYACGTELLQKAASLATQHEVPLHIHLAETRTEVGIIQDRFGLSPAAYLENIGLLRPGFIGAHGVQLNEADQQILASRQVGIAHCPESNMKLASGIAPVSSMQKAGITVGLGTDGAASNNDLDLFEEMSTAAKLHKVAEMDPQVLPAREILAMATIEGARLLGWEDKIGSLEVGKRADMILVNTSPLHLQPLYNVYSHLVYSADGGDVSDVVVEGRLLMENHRLLTLDEQQIISRAQFYRDQLLSVTTAENN
jgi:5-methylthioadenosine/S-adenosylhomocysteine deaminase